MYGDIYRRLYRSTALFGREGIKTLRDTKVFVSGLGGLGAEVVTSLALSGVGAITVHDDTTVCYSDLSSQPFFSEQDVGRQKIDACLSQLQAISSLCDVFPHRGPLLEEEEEEGESGEAACVAIEFFAQFHAVVLANTRMSQEEVERIGDVVHNKAVFVVCNTLGVNARLFVDAGEVSAHLSCLISVDSLLFVSYIVPKSHLVSPPREIEKHFFLSCIEREEIGEEKEGGGKEYLLKVTLGERFSSSVSDNTGLGNRVKLSHVSAVRGDCSRVARELNFDAERQNYYRVVSVEAGSDTDTLKLEPEAESAENISTIELQCLRGFATLEPESKYSSPSKSFRDACVAPGTLDPVNGPILSRAPEDPCKLCIASLFHGWNAIEVFRSTHGGELPQAGNRPKQKEHIDQVISNARELNDAAARKVQDSPGGEKDIIYASPLDEEEVALLAQYARGNLAPVAIYMGGAAAMEVLKSVTGAAEPVQNWYFFSCKELLYGGYLSEEQGKKEREPIGCRYDGAIRVIGQKMQDFITRDASVALFGGRSQGGAIAKMLALCGVAASPGFPSSVTIVEWNSFYESEECTNVCLSPALLRQGSALPRSKDSRGNADLASLIAAAMKSINPDACGVPVAQLDNKELSSLFWAHQDAVLSCVSSEPGGSTSALPQMVRDGVTRYCVPWIQSSAQDFRGVVVPVFPHVGDPNSIVTDVEQSKRARGACPTSIIVNFPCVPSMCVDWGEFALQDRMKPLRMINAFLECPSSCTSENHYASWKQRAREFCDLLDDIISSVSERTETPSKEWGHDWWGLCTWEMCVIRARHWFDRCFVYRSKAMLSHYPLDYVSSGTGMPFWSGSKLLPSPIMFDIDDPLHMEFIVCGARLLARCFRAPIEALDDAALGSLITCVHGIGPTEKENASIRSILVGYKGKKLGSGLPVVEDFSLAKEALLSRLDKMVKIGLLKEWSDGGDADQPGENVLPLGCAKNLQRKAGEEGSDATRYVPGDTWSFICRLPSGRPVPFFSKMFRGDCKSGIPKRMGLLELAELDFFDDANDQMRFITVTAKLKAREYGIPCVSFVQAKLECTKRLGGVAPVDSMVAGLAGLELIKTLRLTFASSVSPSLSVPLEDRGALGSWVLPRNGADTGVEGAVSQGKGDPGDLHLWRQWVVRVLRRTRFNSAMPKRMCYILALEPPTCALISDDHLSPIMGGREHWTDWDKLTIALRRSDITLGEFEQYWITKYRIYLTCISRHRRLVFMPFIHEERRAMNLISAIAQAAGCPNHPKNELGRLTQKLDGHFRQLTVVFENEKEDDLPVPSFTYLVVKPLHADKLRHTLARYNFITASVWNTLRILFIGWKSRKKKHGQMYAFKNNEGEAETQGNAPFSEPLFAKLPIEVVQVIALRYLLTTVNERAFRRIMSLCIPLVTLE